MSKIKQTTTTASYRTGKIDESRIEKFTAKDLKFYGEDMLKLYPESVKFQTSSGAWGWMPTRESAVTALEEELKLSSIIRSK